MSVRASDGCSNRRLRIAFLTPEFIGAGESGGGLATYLRRMCLALIDAGHEPEVFVTHPNEGSALSDGDVPVHRVAPVSHESRVVLRALGRIPARPFPMRIVSRLRAAEAMEVAFEARHREAPFDAVQSPNYGLSGYFVRPRRGRVHLVRCSQPTAAYARAERTFAGGLRGGFSWPDDVATERAEQRLFARVDAVYAPSDYVASLYAKKLARNIRTLRPPFALEDMVGEPPPALPPRFFAFVGKADRVKGADLLARAVDLASRFEPALRVVCAGPVDFVAVARRAGTPSTNLSWVGPLKKPVLYAFEKRAVAVVAPSRSDNLPNTVIEALMLGVPVIGSRGASIDELVEDGETGELVTIGDVSALADALVRAWRGEGRWSTQRAGKPRRLDDYSPERAVAGFLELVESCRSR